VIARQREKDALPPQFDLSKPPAGCGGWVVVGGRGGAAMSGHRREIEGKSSLLFVSTARSWGDSGCV